jgi:type III secretory pathway component EscT
MFLVTTAVSSVRSVSPATAVALVVLVTVLLGVALPVVMTLPAWASNAAGTFVSITIVFVVDLVIALAHHQAWHRNV